MYGYYHFGWSFWRERAADADRPTRRIRRAGNTLQDKPLNVNLLVHSIWTPAATRRHGRRASRRRSRRR